MDEGICESIVGSMWSDETFVKMSVAYQKCKTALELMISMCFIDHSFDFTDKITYYDTIVTRMKEYIYHTMNEKVSEYYEIYLKDQYEVRNTNCVAYQFLICKFSDVEITYDDLFQ